jgi:pyruvate formate lyase activating enzyme
MTDHQATALATLKRAEAIGKEAGLKYIYLGNVGADSPTRCHHCDTILIARNGYGVTENRIGEYGECPVCSSIIEGVWK